MFRRLLKLLVSIGYCALEQICFRPLRFLAGRDSGRLTVLTYHQVSQPQRAAFTRQLALIRKHGTPVFADWNGAATDRGRFVAVTFDDFLAEALAVAGPALAQARIPSTWFVVSGPLGAKVNWIKNSQFHNQAADIASADDLARLDRQLFRIGSHTLSHAQLPRLAPEELELELRRSKSDLETATGGPVTMLSLPYGEYRNSILPRCLEAGYRFVFSNVPVWRLFSHAGLLRGRVPVEPTDWPLEFRLKLAGGYDWLALPGYLRSQLIPRFQSGKQPSGTADKRTVEA